MQIKLWKTAAYFTYNSIVSRKLSNITSLIRDLLLSTKDTRRNNLLLYSYASMNVTKGSSKFIKFVLNFTIENSTPSKVGVADGLRKKDRGS